MKIYDLKFYKESSNDYSKVVFYIINEECENPIKVTIYTDGEVFLYQSSEHRYHINNKYEVNLFEIAFNQAFINLLFNGNYKQFTMNNEDNIKVFEKFKDQIKNIIEN